MRLGSEALYEQGFCFRKLYLRVAHDGEPCLVGKKIFPGIWSGNATQYVRNSFNSGRIALGECYSTVNTIGRTVIDHAAQPGVQRCFGIGSRSAAYTACKQANDWLTYTSHIDVG